MKLYALEIYKDKWTVHYLSVLPYNVPGDYIESWMLTNHPDETRWRIMEYEIEDPAGMLWTHARNSATLETGSL